MKFFIVLLPLIAMAFGGPVVKTWTLNELSEALETKKVDPELKPYVEDALNQIMLALFTGQNKESIQARVPSPTGGATWTMDELEKAIEDPTSKYRPFILQAYQRLQNSHDAENSQDSIEVHIPALDISTWTLSDINTALKSASTDPELRTYLNDALKKLTNASDKRKKISIVTPVGLVKTKLTQPELFKPS